MAFLSTTELSALLPSCISSYNPKRLKEVGYELALGNQVYMTDSETGKREILDGNNTQIEIKPGQFALLLTEEAVEIPNDKIAFISIKFGVKIKGLINVSGFHVDPGFKGKIIFSVYNAGPTSIIMDRGEPYFMIWFSELSSTAQTYNGAHQGQNEISGTLVGQLKGELASPNVLLDRIKSNESLLKNFIWAAGIAIGLGITLTVKSVWDTSKYNEGYNVGVKEKEAKDYIHSALTSYKLDSIISTRIDSVFSNYNLKNDSTKK